MGHLEFSGFSPSGHRLMGVARTGSRTTHLNPDQYLTWYVPDLWNLEEAATVPLAYATVRIGMSAGYLPSLNLFVHVRLPLAHITLVLYVDNCS